MRTNGWVLLVMCAIALVGFAALVDSRGGRAALRRRFGPEYERAIREHGDRRSAERYLNTIVDRRETFIISGLNESTKKELAARWQANQNKFVDDPAGVTGEADTLVAEVLYGRGYPETGFAERADLLATDHPELAARYREAHRWASGGAGAQPDTEHLRRAVLGYRDLFHELVGAGDEPAGRQPASGLPG